MQLEMYSMTELDLIETANQVKDLLLVQLEKDNVLKDSVENVASKYVVTIRKPGLFGTILDKLFPIKKDSTNFVILINTKKLEEAN